ncbi:hypothetical protein M6B38_231650 [Iris pallida]|uniref:Uncharacterized protein n=1 Tax=Iris pallida TaxID=29817 RepID=A0AAX6DR41_IRIPA|nr:hypothetical protein M6B38_231650 [Iris pallida]
MDRYRRPETCFSFRGTYCTSKDGFSNREDSPTSCPLKQEESHCNGNITSNVGDHDTDGIDLLEELLIPENKTFRIFQYQLPSVAVP